MEELSELLQSLNPEGYELEDLDDIDGLEEGLDEEGDLVLLEVKIRRIM